MDLGLKGKVAIVCASSEGLGKASALALAKEGAKLVICSRREKAIADAADEIQRQTGSEVFPVVADVSIGADAVRIVRTAVEKFGTVHILVNNAGGPPTGDILSLTDEQWQKAHDLTLMSMVRMTREVIPFMVKQNWGRIVTITSFVAKQPLDELILSVSIRPGIHGLSKILSNQYSKNNISVNTVCPGNIFTKRQEELAPSRAASKKISVEEYLKAQTKSIPAGRYGKPEEIGDVVAFLCSERASYISGVNLLVDGGLAKGIH
ncbi:MAG TPA: SDR family oxidoreductase [Bacteroidota bacterium]